MVETKDDSEEMTLSPQKTAEAMEELGLYCKSTGRVASGIPISLFENEWFMETALNHLAQSDCRQTRDPRTFYIKDKILDIWVSTGIWSSLQSWHSYCCVNTTVDHM